MKVLFWGLIVAGFAGCTVFGIGPVLKRMGGNWLSGPMLAGTVLGVAILVLAVMFATGVRPALLPRDLDMAYALAVLIGAKVVVGALTVSGVIARG
ncbi:MAG: hypothetical protein ACYCX5_11960 [Coriobacteriia bacterium]